MRVNKYLVLHSGDRILMRSNCCILIGGLEAHQNYLNANFQEEIKPFKKDVQESASHIELVLSHKDQ